MAAREIIVPGAMPSRDRNGRVLPGKLRFYDPGTAFSTPATIYTTSALDVAHDFPILSDASGRWPAMWADEADEFDVAWSDQVNDAPQGQWTDLSPADDAVLASVDMAQAAQDAAEDAQAAAEAAQAQAEALLADATGEPFRATSTTSLTIGTGSKSLTLAQTGKLFTIGQTIVCARTSAGDTQMTGVITAFDGDTGALTFNSAATGGSGGPFTDWSISLSSAGGVQSIAGETGIVTAAEARTALDVMTTAEVKAFAAALAIAL